MSQIIKLKRSAVPNKKPTDLALGEIAINTYDGKMYIKKDGAGDPEIIEVGSLASLPVDPTFDSITLSGSPGPIVWNNTEETVNIPLNDDVTLQVGQEQVFRGKATEAISNGDVVMFAGAQGNHLLIAKADISATGFRPEHVIGLATQDFALNDFGFVTSFGKVRGLDTTSFSEGDILYLDPANPGVLTTVVPTPPNHIIQLCAVVRSHGTQGTVLVRPTHFPDTDEIVEGLSNLYFTDARAVAAVAAADQYVKNTGDTINGDLNVVGDLYITASADDGWRFRPGVNPGFQYGFTDTHGNAQVFTNEQGTVNQAFVLGDTSPDSSNTLFGVSAIAGGNNPTTGNEAWIKKLNLTGAGDLYIGSSGTSEVWHAGNLNPSDYLLTSNYVDDYVASAFFNTTSGILTLTRAEGGTVTVDLDGRYLQTETDNQTLSWNGTNGELVISGGNTVDLDGRYQLSGNYDNYTSWTASDGTNTAAVTSGETVTINGSGATTVSLDAATQTYTISSTDTDTNTWRPIHDTPANGATTTSISSNWAFDNVKTAVPAGAVFTDTETTTTLTKVGNELRYVNEAGTTQAIDLSLYLDDTNLAKIISGTMNSSGIATFKRDDNTTFTVDMSVLLDDTNLSRITNASWNTGDGVLTLTRNDSSNVAVDLDGRYVQKSGDTMTGNLTLNSATPQIFFNGTSDAGVDMAIKATPEGLDFYEPEQANKIQFQILDDGGVNSPFGYKVGGVRKDVNWDNAYNYSQIGHLPLSGGTVTGETIIDGGVGVDSTGTFHVRQKGDTVNDGIAITSSFSGSHRIWKDSNGVLNFGVSNNGDQFGIDVSGNLKHNGTTFLDSSRNLTNMADGTFSGTVTAASFSGNLNYNDITNPPTIDNSVDYINAASFNTGNGVLTLSGPGRAGATVDLDNRYLQSYTETDTLDTVTSRGAVSNKNITINAPDTGSAPAITALLKIHGYEGRGAGIKIKDSINSATGSSDREWFVGTGYSQSGFSIGYSSTGLQSSYLAQSKLRIDTNGNTVISGTLAATSFSGNLNYNDITNPPTIPTVPNAVSNITHDTVNTELDVTFTDGTTSSLNLAQYIDDTNLARIVSGSHAGSGIVRFTRDDSTTFDVDFSDFLDDTNLARINSASWNTGNGVLTLTRNDNSTIAVDLDDRYLQSYTETDTLASVTARGRTTSSKLVLSNTGTIGSSTSGMGNASILIGSTSTGIGIDNNEIMSSGGHFYLGTAAGNNNNVVIRQNGIDRVSATSTGAVVAGNLSVSGTITGNINYNQITNPPTIDNAVDYVNSATFSTTTGVLTLSGVGRAGATVDLDNRYLTSYSETDTLQSVTGRGNTTTNNIRFTQDEGGIEWERNTDRASIKFYNDADSDTNSRLEFNIADNTNEDFRFTYTTGTTTTELLRMRPDAGVNGLTFRGNTVFHDAYHPNADKWTTARTNTVTLTGDVTGTGSASVDGSGNWTVTVPAVVANNSHTHDDRYVKKTGDTMTGQLTVNSDVVITGDLKLNGSDSYIWTPNTSAGYTGFWDQFNSRLALHYTNSHSGWGVMGQSESGTALKVHGNTKITGGLEIAGNLARGSYEGASQYHSGADNIVLKGNSVGRSGIFFESEKDGTNINHSSDFGFIQYHAYGTGSSGESNELIIGVSNDADDNVILNAPNVNGLKFRTGVSATDYTVWHAGNLNPSNYLLTSSYADNYVDSVAFNTSNGILTIGRTGSLADLTVDLDGRYITSQTDSQTLSWNGTNGQLSISNGNTVDLDGRYLQSYSETDTLQTVCSRGSSTNTNITSTGNRITINNGGSVYYTADGGTNQWKYLSLQTNGSTKWDIATKDNDLSGALQFRPAGSGTNVMHYSTSGNLTIPGLLTATTKSFTIDHPTKEGYKLRYGSLEGPENGVYVRGRLKGDNTIELPEYWKDLVHEDSITVNLTPIGKGQDIWVEDFDSTEVLVGGENVNCFYVVYGERKDVDKLVTEFKEEV